MGGFRTPAHASTSDLRWPASENLHRSRHLDSYRHIQANVCNRVTVRQPGATAMGAEQT
jgi:hypothetical protein